MRRTAPILALILILSGGRPEPAPAQYEEEAIGVAVGAMGGTVVTLGVVVARARWQHNYLDSVDDLIHWQSTPMLIAPAVGLVFGLAGEDALRGSIVGSTTGLLVGAGVGAGLGWLLSDEQEWPWAGGVIGGAVGMTVGGIANGLIAWGRDEDAAIPLPKELRFGLTIPVP